MDTYDKKNYGHKTIETYEILAAYFTDIFYNHLYNESKKMKIDGKVSSITEGYKHTLNAFIQGLNNAKLYKKYIIGIHHYYIEIGFASISFSNCVDRVTQEFIPIDYYNSLSSTQKMGVLRLVLNSSIKQFIIIIVQNHLTKIIDFHSDKDNARLLQDELINCFILERETMYQRFILDKTNNPGGVNNALISKMQTDIKSIVLEKIELQKKYNQLIKLYMIKKQSEENLKKMNINLIEKLKQKEEKKVESVSPINMKKYDDSPKLSIYSNNMNSPKSSSKLNNLDNNSPKSSSSKLNNLDNKSYRDDNSPESIKDKYKTESKPNEFYPKFTVSNSVLNTIKNIKNNTPIIEEIKEKIIEVTNKNISRVLDDDVMEDSFNNMLESDTTLDDYM